MGGFFLCPRPSALSVYDIEDRYRNSLQVFEKKGLTVDRRLIGDGFVVWRFHKRNDAHDHVLELPNGDFVLFTGTMLYDGKVGKPALVRLYEDFAEGRTIEPRLSGNYGIVIHGQQSLTIFSDYSGYYPIYCDAARSVFSNSLMAVARAAGPTPPSQQEFFEYLLFGFFVGEETLFPNVRVLDSKKLWTVWPAVQSQQREPSFRPLDASAPLPAMAKRVADELSDYFGKIGNAFEGPIGLALSGGYDTRLMLALIRHLGQTPYLYVYGGAQDSDVTVAKAIGAGEGLAVDHIDKSKFARVTVDDFAADMERQLYFFDGIKPLGTIDDGSDLSTRIERADKASLQLNGAGGEIYREIWNLSDRTVSLSTFLRMRFDRGSYAFCQPVFDADEFFARFATKVQGMLAIERPWLLRREAEALFPFLRNLLAAPNNAANNQISYALVPFIEPRFIFPSFDIPISFKYCGEFHATLIRILDPALAHYPSSYGINFYDPPPLFYRLRRRIERNIPLHLRLLKRAAPRRASARPYYLDDTYVRSVVEPDDLRISQFVDVGKIDEPELLSRALSVEMLVSHV